MELLKYQAYCYMANISCVRRIPGKKLYKLSQVCVALSHVVVACVYYAKSTLECWERAAASAISKLPDLNFAAMLQSGNHIRAAHPLLQCCQVEEEGNA